MNEQGESRNPFVFATVGTDHHPFSRLVEAVDDWAARSNVPVFIQSGSSHPPRFSAFSPLLPFSEMNRLLMSAAGIVSHGGPATIVQIRAAGKVPIVMPRDPALGEHVDDHQIRFARHLAARGEIVLAETITDLRTALDRLVSDPESFRLTPNSGESHRAVANFERLILQTIRRRRRVFSR